MINSILTAMQLILIIFSLFIIFRNLVNGDEKRSTYLGLALNTCLLWLTII